MFAPNLTRKSHRNSKIDRHVVVPPLTFHTCDKVRRSNVDVIMSCHQFDTFALNSTKKILQKHQNWHKGCPCHGWHSAPVRPKGQRFIYKWSNK